VIHGQDYYLLVDNFEGVPEFAGVSNAGDVIEARAMLFQKGDELGGGSMYEAENNTVIYIAGGGVPGGESGAR